MYNTYYLCETIPPDIYPKVGEYLILEGVSEQEVLDILKNETVLGRGLGKVVSLIKTPNLHLVLSYRLKLGIPSNKSIKKLANRGLVIIVSPSEPFDADENTEFKDLIELSTRTTFNYLISDLRGGK